MPVSAAGVALADMLLGQLDTLQTPQDKAPLNEQDLIHMCQVVRELLLGEAVVVDVAPPVAVFGDIHGQLFDLRSQMQLAGSLEDRSYVFLGDYVDRGRYSIETITTLLALKIKYPSRVCLLRGNHECANVNRIYGFYDDCKRRFSIRLWKQFTSVFECLPLAAVVAARIFCVHGGLSPDLDTIKQLRALQKPVIVADSGLATDVLWSDPDYNITGWGDNDRGVGYTFGANVVADFLASEGMDLICRAHQVVEDGYEFFAGRRLVTIFGAPNYCGEFDNAAAVLQISRELLCTFAILPPSKSKKNLQRMATSVA